MSKVILFGIGRGADVAFRFLKRDSEHEVRGFAADGKYLERDTFHDLPVVAFENIEQRFPPDQYKLLILLGYQRMNALRAEKYLAAKAKGYGFISYVNSQFYRAEDLNIGENCFIMDNQSISLDVKIGNNVVMWSSNHVGDLSSIGDHSWLASHVTIAADVDVRPYCFLGIGATVANKLTLGQRTFVGANALVASSTAENSVHVASSMSEAVDLDSSAFMRVMMAKGKL
jgi:sugar O-acyltransferase (sialic acid O-acetyltransferase NeuD family)